MKKIISVLLCCAMIAALFIPVSLAEDDAASAPCVCWGDIDGSKTTTSADARLVLRQSVGLEHYPEEALYKCDLDKDGRISSFDARFVLRLSVNLEKYPAHEMRPVVGREATCTEDGLTDGLYCPICETELKEQETIPSPGHNEVVDEAVAATCTEDGLTEGRHCSVCNLVFVAQEKVPALGHQPVAVTATATDVCQEAQVCERCHVELSPELKHDIEANATVTAQKGVVCKRCDKTLVPSFNALVNNLKTEPHYFRHFMQTDTEIDSPTFKGVMVFFKSEFEKEFNESASKETEYSALTNRTEVNAGTFEIVGSDQVSLLTDADLESTKTETVSGIDFLKSLPDTFTSQYGRLNDLRDIKAKEFGDVLKITVALKPERYSELKDKGGVDAIGRISTEFEDLITEAMREFSSLNEDFLRSDCDTLSKVTVSYYFDKDTMQPITAQYHLNMDIDQSMSIDLSGLNIEGLHIPSVLGNTGSIGFKVHMDTYSYVFFDSYFD